MIEQMEILWLHSQLDEANKRIAELETELEEAKEWAEERIAQLEEFLGEIPYGHLPDPLQSKLFRLLEGALNELTGNPKFLDECQQAQNRIAELEQKLETSEYVREGAQRQLDRDQERIADLGAILADYQRSGKSAHEVMYNQRKRIAELERFIQKHGFGPEEFLEKGKK